MASPGGGAMLAAAYAPAVARSCSFKRLTEVCRFAVKGFAKSAFVSVTL
jgi:hypothetical protein